MKKTVKIALILLALVLVTGGVFLGIALGRSSSYIGRDMALELALADAGLDRSQVWDTDVDLERERGQSWYEVDFDSRGYEYSYVIDPTTGRVLYASSEPD